MQAIYCKISKCTIPILLYVFNPLTEMSNVYSFRGMIKKELKIIFEESKNEMPKCMKIFGTPITIGKVQYYFFFYGVPAKTNFDPISICTFNPYKNFNISRINNLLRSIFSH